MRGGGEPAALDRREMLAHRVHLDDLRAAREQRLLTACLSASVIPSAGSAISDEPPPEIRATTRSSAVSPLHRVKDACAGLLAHRVRASDARPPSPRCGPRAHVMAVAGDHDAAEIDVAPGVIERRRHRGRGLAGADHHAAALWLLRQMPQHRRPGSALATAASNMPSQDRPRAAASVQLGGIAVGSDIRAVDRLHHGVGHVLASSRCRRHPAS